MDEYRCWRIGIRLAVADKPRFGLRSFSAIAVELAKRVIEAYRSENGLRDLFGHNRGAVTVTTIDGTDIFGSNSGSPTYTASDFAAVVRLRDKLAEKYPKELSAKNIGVMPHNALFHAETTVLLRAARQNGGSLAGRTLTIFGDTRMCNNCEYVLPYVGLELGNPTVTFVDPDGSTRMMRDGSWVKQGGQMRKRAYFDIFDGPGWPSPGQLQRYFLAAPGQRWLFESRNDCWGLSAEGVDGTEHLPANQGRIDIRLTMLGNPDHGVLLHYQKSGRDYREAYYSKEDMKRLREWIETVHGELMPIGLYVPFERAWAGVKEFMEMDGALPKSIAWIGEDDIPGDAFPDPYLHRLAQS